MGELGVRVVERVARLHFWWEECPRLCVFQKPLPRSPGTIVWVGWGGRYGSLRGAGQDIEVGETRATGSC